MVYRPEYVEAALKRREAKRPEAVAFVQSQRDYAQVLTETVPGIQSFYSKLLRSGDIESALCTGALQQLKEQGLFKTEKQFVTVRKFAEKFRPLQMSLISEGVVDIAMKSNGPIPAEAWHQIDLVVQLKPVAGGRFVNIDTEFFSPHLSLDGQENPFDDTEKLHIIWQVDVQKKIPRSLIYLGFGSNQPHRLQHARNDETGLGGKSRFYIYDPYQDPGRFLHYDMGPIRDCGPYDWSWQVIPLSEMGGSWEIRFVSLGGDSPIYLFDPVIVDAAKNLSKDVVLDIFCKQIGVSPSLKFEELSDPLREKFSSRIRLCVRRLTEIIGQRPEGVPTIQEVNDRAGRDYAAYYGALLAPSVRALDAPSMLAVLRHRIPARFKEYESLLQQPCIDVFVEQYHQFLPSRMQDLFSAPTQDCPLELSIAIGDWLENLMNGLRRDLFHYGQNPYERVHVLRLGILLATDERFGGAYWRILDQAEQAARREECFGEFDITLPSE